ncbi:hypothetical protein TNCT_497321 [Trichonephila clavata]|uniref:Uncharacterized protein n=1 Tax=Trichonephila clavata TaxID=2740835 RepID=A0A8X6KTJ5_TRICU|nr:hypothetical protein TNCT_497321 [Trichonephila clavata]
MHLVSNLKAAVRGGRKNKDREQMSDNLPLQCHIILTWEVLIYGQTNLILPDIHTDQEMDNACLCIFFEYGHLQCLDYAYRSLQAM